MLTCNNAISAFFVTLLLISAFLCSPLNTALCSLVFSPKILTYAPILQELSMMSSWRGASPSTCVVLPATNFNQVLPPTLDASTAAVNAIIHHKSAKCGTHAEQRCGGCIEGLDRNGDPSATYYCSRKCQLDHRGTHKSQCKLAIDRRQLHRILLCNTLSTPAPKPCGTTRLLR